MDKAVKVVRLNNEKYGMVFREPGSGRGLLVGIDNGSGQLMFQDLPGTYTFDSEIACIQRIQSLRYKIEVLCSGVCVVGYICIGNFAGILVATNVRQVASFPGGHIVYVIAASQWITIPLHNMSLSSKTDTTREDYRLLELVQKFPVDNVHYFCETVDITRPFPSSRDVDSPSWEFVWNGWLTQPFRQLADFPFRVYPILLQGLVEQANLKDLRGVPYTVTVISRRSRLHPGTRYRARGVNRNAEPANEVEMEQIVWSTTENPIHNLQGSKNQTDWRSVVWRRGSVPLVWGTIFNINNVTKPVIWIGTDMDRHTKAARRYVRRIQKRYHRDNPEYDSSLKYPIRIVSLLRKGTIDKERSEAKLVEVYDTVLRRISKGVSQKQLQQLTSDAESTCTTSSTDSKSQHLLQLLQSQVSIDVNHIDWHHITELQGLQDTVSIFWQGLADVIEKFGFTYGTLSSQKQSDNQDQKCFGQLYVTHSKHQKGVLRFNCADSLDRTNVASFYCTVQILVEQCRSLGLAVTQTPQSYISSRGSSGFLKQWGQNLRQGGKKLDEEDGQQMKEMSGHSKSSPSIANQKGEKEDQQKEWELLRKADVSQFRKSVDQSLLNVVKFMFLANGNLHAQIYTESEAMHTHQLDVFDIRETAPKAGWMGHVKNGVTAVTRRYHNLLSDETRMKVMEMFLGMKVTEHFQGIPLVYQSQDMCELDDTESDTEQESEEPSKEDVDKATGLQDVLVATSGLSLQ